jgi:Mg2+-importing ATPase
MTLIGYLLFADPTKPNIEENVAALRKSGIEIRIISGDSRYVAQHVAESVGLATRLVTGSELDALNDRALARRIRGKTVFAEIAPDQKERIVAALRKAGHTVGFLGDGINDAPALRAADVGISVDNAVDAARAAADIILLERDLMVLLDGIIAGRHAFANTIKYISITISANLGNMLSMAVASLALPFLPLTASQVLLNNLLSDLPMLAVSTDRVDTQMLARPWQWNFPALLRSMIAFGLLSSFFDGLTFVVLLSVFRAGEPTFQSAWFVESLLTELAVVAVMRTALPFFKQTPSRLLTTASAAIAAAAIVVPYTPIAGLIGFVPLPFGLLCTILVIVASYVLATELLKARISPFEIKAPA